MAGSETTLNGLLKSEARNPKSETILNDQNPNDQNKGAWDLKIGKFFNP
jgi:hypothetical protein